MPCNCNKACQNAQCSCYDKNNCDKDLMSAGAAGCNNVMISNATYDSKIAGMTDLQLATSYVVPQVYKQSYTPSKALSQGTCFPELDMEY